MNYSDQRTFLLGSRAWAIFLDVLLLAAAGYCLLDAPRVPVSVSVLFVCIIATLAAAIFYGPDYLTLTVAPDKWLRWEIRIRWRIAGVVLILGLIFVAKLHDVVLVIGAVLWIVAVNLFAKKVLRSGSLRAYFYAADFALLMVVFFLGSLDLLTRAALLAVVVHISLVVCERFLALWAVVLSSASTALLLISPRQQVASREFLIAATVLVWISAAATSWLVFRARRQNRRSIDAAIKELMEFTGYSGERIREQWATSNQQLAKNWLAAHLPEGDGERISAWYRENSELYLFAISAYNLEYKRIRANLSMLRYARGACLDYGAGNGEFLLELARRGHPVTYFDVDGETMRFARARAESRGLKMQFAHTKDELILVAGQKGFDTITSFDVLEHIPDLAAELDFLSSLLNPGGRLIFDVPAGTTRSHPMHLNHQLDIRAHMREKGMLAAKDARHSFSFKKQQQERHIFTKAGVPT